jgi:glycerol kinase
MAVGYWSDRNQLGDATGRGATVFEPAMGEDQRRALYAGWKRAVERSMGWQVE